MNLGEQFHDCAPTIEAILYLRCFGRIMATCVQRLAVQKEVAS
jgi:hypothetical protein